MSEFLTLEEIKLWRSSTEKLTLEEFARKLGKNLNEKKETNDLYDIIRHQEEQKPEEIEPIEIKKEVIQPRIIKPAQQVIEVQEPAKPEVVQTVKEIKPVPEDEKIEKFEIEVTFKKELAPREKVIFEYLAKNKGKRVMIKELAKALNLPNDYVYKYIKNLREKIVQNVLVNADDGGYILSI